jgi:hypothetical protein
MNGAIAILVDVPAVALLRAEHSSDVDALALLLEVNVDRSLDLAGVQLNKETALALASAIGVAVGRQLRSCQSSFPFLTV